MQVLFVCTANLCRSPYMELWARARLGRSRGGAGVVVGSAGTRARDGEPLGEEMRPGLREVGVTEAELDAHRSRRVNRALLDGADLVLVASREHRTVLLADRPASYGSVLTLRQAAAAARRVPAGVRGADALSVLAGHRGHAGADDDIDDPHRRGPEAVRTCATEVAAALEVVLPVLVPDSPTAPQED